MQLENLRSNLECGCETNLESGASVFKVDSITLGLCAKVVVQKEDSHVW